MNDTDDIDSASIELPGGLEDNQDPAESAAIESQGLANSEDSSQDTGETAEVQAELPADTSFEDASPPLNAENIIPGGVSQTQTERPEATKDWLDHLARFHHDMNGLLAAKENLKLVAVNVSARQSFYRKWSYEANQVLRITALVRRRLENAHKAKNKAAS